MKALISYASVHHGNTKKIAEAMTQAISAELVAVKDLTTKNIDRYDLIGFGSGIYFSKHHRSLLDAVDALPYMPGKKAFIFSTAGFPAGKFLFHRPLKTKLREKGFIITWDFSCRGLDTYKIFGPFGGMNRGHPDNNDLDRAQTFAKKMAGL